MNRVLALSNKKKPTLTALLEVGRNVKLANGGVKRVEGYTQENHMDSMKYLCERINAHLMGTEYETALKGCAQLLEELRLQRDRTGLVSSYFHCQYVCFYVAAKFKLGKYKAATQKFEKYAPNMDFQHEFSLQVLDYYLAYKLKRLDKCLMQRNENVLVIFESEQKKLLKLCENKFPKNDGRKHFYRASIHFNLCEFKKAYNIAYDVLDRFGGILSTSRLEKMDNILEAIDEINNAENEQI